jgi:hypothetical protein
MLGEFLRVISEKVLPREYSGKFKSALGVTP